MSRDGGEQARGVADRSERLVRGLDAQHRFRCGACGNLTRFDVVERARTRRYHHVTLGGIAAVEEEEVLDHEVESVTCRWCGRSDAIDIEEAPAAAVEGS